MKKHFKLQNYIEDEAEDEDECSKDEDEIDDTKIDTQIINVKANLNEEKNRRKRVYRIPRTFNNIEVLINELYNIIKNNIINRNIN